MQANVAVHHRGSGEGLEAFFEQDVSQYQEEEEVPEHLDALPEHLDDRPEAKAHTCQSTLSPQQLVFERFDADGSGGYNRTELAAFLRHFRNVSYQGQQELWRQADVDGNSEIDVEELLDCVVNPASCVHLHATAGAGTALDQRASQVSPSRDREGPQEESEHRGPLELGQSSHTSLVRAMQKAERRMELLESEQMSEEEALAKTRSNLTLMRLYLMPDKGLNTKAGAVCLDGSDAGFYFAPAADPRRAGRWIVMIEGGGWCGSASDCLARSFTSKGSSKEWNAVTYRGGLMSDDCTANPHFCDYNRVIVNYCDGASLTGDRVKPLIVEGASGANRSLYFRGRRILDAVLDTLLTNHGLDQAEQVLLAGCSAGGLSTLVHADHVNERLSAAVPTLTKFRAVPLSGFFLQHNSVENEAVYPEFLHRVAMLANSTWALNRRCLASMPTGKSWSCIFPQVSLAHTETPVFLVNSAMDWWSGLCILWPSSTIQKVAADPSGACGKSHQQVHYACGENVERCTPFEMFAMNQYIRDFSSTLEATESSFLKAGNGAFIHSCHTHCEALDDSWTRIAIHGTTMHQAVLRWWRSDGAPRSSHLYKPCEYGQGGPGGTKWPYQCNPTCMNLPA